jgi:hypothetical protein
MDKLGLETVRQRQTQRLPVTDAMPYPEADFVLGWIAEKERPVKIWRAVLAGAAIVAAVAACIAAWPVIKGWFG